ncbi:1-deoxy-D-xylulose-5-phosphate reductoisomerase [Hathewaya histolytica]|uniref:1-deoxy-D-xylulose-5-phosphate reductoisomerase n=1 Tax=Hathewaya histolytica TaxID=1498 RepID=UPI003B685E8A
MKNISILGGTGSIGTQALDIIRKESEKFKLIAISANNNVNKVIEIIDEFNPKYIAMMDEYAAKKIEEYCRINYKKTQTLKGMEGLIAIATLPEVDMVLTSVVGMIGLKPTIEAIRHKKDIALANKETLVVAGDLVMGEAKKYNVKILPVDSEHGAIFQCLQGHKKEDIDKILLTGSGGPFRGRKAEKLQDVLPEEALKHPKWNMGRKISIDSATLMNKGLEVIEAHYLFDIDYENIEVIIHPESIIHSMVQYKDGTVISQMSCTDMKLPIQYAMSYPNRGKRLISKLDLFKIKSLNFSEPDMETFKCLKLAFKAGKMKGNMPVILNAANEVAVQLFLEHKIKFLDIGNLVEDSMNYFEYKKNLSIEEIVETDLNVRKYIKNKFN